jgi:hypothetical protein
MDVYGHWDAAEALNVPRSDVFEDFGVLASRGEAADVLLHRSKDLPDEICKAVNFWFIHKTVLACSHGGVDLELASDVDGLSVLGVRTYLSY